MAPREVIIGPGAPDETIVAIGPGDVLEITSVVGQKLRVVGITRLRTSYFWMTMGAAGVLFGFWLSKVL